LTLDISRRAATLDLVLDEPTTANSRSGRHGDPPRAPVWDEAPPAAVRGTPGEGALDDRDRAPRKHVFAVNSSPDFLLIVREVLTDEGYAVTTCHFEPNVFTRIIMRQPDALIIDVAPGESAGWDLLRQLHLEAKTSEIPVVVTSTSPPLLKQARNEATRSGTNRSFLTKPLDLDELVKTTRDMVGDA
jgi:CheY-like chemotaxis protein